MINRDRLMKAALQATLAGRRRDAMALWTILLVHSPGDPDALAGLRTLGLNVPPGKPPDTSDRSPKALLAPLPPASRPARRPPWGSRVTATLALLTALMLLAAGGCSAVLAFSLSGSTRSVDPAASPGADPEPCPTPAGPAVPPLLTAGEEARLIVESAVWRFQEENGRLPGAWGELLPAYLDKLPPVVPPGIESTLNGSGNPAAALELRASKRSRVLQVVSGGRVLRTFPIAIGEENLTPEGRFRVTERSVLAGRTASGQLNPFGTRWLGFDIRGPEGAFGIHGTPTPEVVGMGVSRGCLVLRNEDLEELYAMVPRGTPITIQD